MQFRNIKHILNIDVSQNSHICGQNAPQPYHPAAVAFINHSLDHWAGGVGKWAQRFTHHDTHHIERDLAVGVVTARKKKERGRACLDPCMM